jgi:hypothetical protein
MNHFFYNTIFQLRSKEEMLLYDRVIEFSLEDEELVKNFLRKEFETESLNYPFNSSIYNAEAALWAAKIIYTSCQLLLYREHENEELPELLPDFPFKKNVDSILSADLCLRFLPQVILEAKSIDESDYLVPILEKIIQEWHYSGIGIDTNLEYIKLEMIFSNSCLEQLYIDRVIDRKDLGRAQIPELKNKIKSSLGNHLSYFWKELKEE